MGTIHLWGYFGVGLGMIPGWAVMGTGTAVGVFGGGVGYGYHLSVRQILIALFNSAVSGTVSWSFIKSRFFLSSHFQFTIII